MKPPAASGGVRPAPLVDRIAARSVDLLVMGAVFVALSLAVALLVRTAHGVVAFGTAPVRITWRDLGAAWHLFALALAVALSLEPFTLGVRRVASSRAVSIGKYATDLELRCVAQPGQTAPTGRAIGRYLLSVGACAVAAGLSFVAALVAGVGLTLWRVVGLTAVPIGFVWSTALLPALLRADRRGWHDVAAGTVLVRRRGM
ncbi:MAG: hypothetical protein OXG44_01670 [Gammaproteobacteria bacterium]|nr:hypothetical protein [Gammaproteobacteria bacterium]